MVGINFLSVGIIISCLGINFLSVGIIISCLRINFLSVGINIFCLRINFLSVGINFLSVEKYFCWQMNGNGKKAFFFLGFIYISCCFCFYITLLKFMIYYHIKRKNIDKLLKCCPMFTLPIDHFLKSFLLFLN